MRLARTPLLKVVGGVRVSKYKTITMQEQTTKPNDPVHPTIKTSWTDDGTKTTTNVGITKRELMAMHIYIGILSKPSSVDLEYTAAYAVRAADTLIKELNK